MSLLCHGHLSRRRRSELALSSRVRHSFFSNVSSPIARIVELYRVANIVILLNIEGEPGVQ